MMLIWAEGFDHYTVSGNGRTEMLSGAWAAFTAGNGTLPALDTAQKRSGTHSLHISYNSSATDSPLARRVMAAAQIVVGLSAGIYFDALPSANKGHGIEFRNGANQCIAYFAVESDGAIGLYTGSGRTLIASSDPVITASGWHHMEMKLVIDGVVGSAECRVNQVSVLNVTDINLGGSGATQMAFGMPAGKVGAGLNWYLDDLVAWNDVGDDVNDFLGPVRVETLFCDADTAQADWGKFGDTDGFDCIDNIPPDGDTTYLTSDTAGDVSEFEFPTLPPETANIKGIYVPLMGKLVAAGSGNVQASLVSGGDVSLGPDVALTTQYTYWGGVHEVDPDTGLPWTKSAVEAAKLRIEKTV